MYLWGNGRYGQMTGMGTNYMIPSHVPSLSQTQQVDILPQNMTSPRLLLSFNVNLPFWIFLLSFRLCVGRTVPSWSSPMEQYWLWVKDSMADWARGILMTSMSPLLFLLFKVKYSSRAKSELLLGYLQNHPKVIINFFCIFL